MMFKEFLSATGAYFEALVLVVLVFSFLLFVVCGYEKHAGAVRNFTSFVLYLGLVAIGTLFLVLFGGWMVGLGLSMAFGSFLVGFVSGRKEGVDQGMREGLGALHDEAIERGFAYVDSGQRFVWKEKSQIKREP
jgi:ribose/xylose/arabinose/galactoside ABC-type transport system permease subunit